MSKAASGNASCASMPCAQSRCAARRRAGSPASGSRPAPAAGGNRSFPPARPARPAPGETARTGPAPVRRNVPPSSILSAFSTVRAIAAYRRDRALTVTVSSSRRAGAVAQDGLGQVVLLGARQIGGERRCAGRIDGQRVAGIRLAARRTPRSASRRRAARTGVRETLQSECDLLLRQSVAGLEAALPRNVQDALGEIEMVGAGSPGGGLHWRSRSAARPARRSARFHDYGLTYFFQQ